MSEHRDAGAVTTIVALCLVFVFVPLLAVTVDVGRVLVSRSAQQNAADNAAMAAAWAACNGEDPVGAARSSAENNGFPAGGSTIIEVTDRDNGSWGVAIGVQVPGVFSPVVGVETVPVSAKAAATCSTEPTPAPVIYGHSTCQHALTWSGNEHQVTGDAHSNGGFVVSGNRNAHVGSATYTGSASVHGNQNTFTPDAPSKVPAKTWPFWLDINDFDTGGSYASRPDYVVAPGTETINSQWLRNNGYLNGNTLASKIYYTDGKIDISDNGMTGTATFVARGDVTFSGINITVQPYVDEIVVLSGSGNGSCGPDAVKLSGNSIHLGGIVFAPYGGIALAGNYNAINGAVLGNAVTLSGNELSITTRASVTMPGSPRVGLDAWD